MIWAHYILQVNIYLTLFYCFYKLLLSKETYFLFNRVYLVVSGLLSLAIPFLRIEWFTRQEATQQIYAGVGQINTMVENVSLAAVPDAQFNWGKLIVLIYLAGVALFIIKLIFQLAILKKLLNGIAGGQAFSFFSKKVIDPALPNGDVINHHEDIHIKQLHTVDLIFFELLTIFIWFNPIIYFYKRTIKSIHEYLADERAASYQGDKEQYALLLLSKAFKVDPHMLTNNFYNKSLIKRRIFMLHKQRSNKVAILKYGLFVPLFALTLVLSSATIRENEKIREVAEDLPISETILSPVSSALLLPEIDIVAARRASKQYNDPDLDGLRKYLATAIRYPAPALEKHIQGNALIKFTVANGLVKDVGTNKSLGAGCDTEAMKAILGYTAFEEIPDGKYMIIFQFRIAGADSEILNNESETLEGYKKLSDISIVGFADKPKAPGIILRGRSGITFNGEIDPLLIVNGEEMDKFTFQGIDPKEIDDLTILKDISAVSLYGDKAKNGVIVITLKGDKTQEKTYDYVSVDIQPTYVGGIDKFRGFVARSIRYPKEAVDKGIQGTVYASFIVEKDGSLTNITVDRKLGYGLDEEAIKVIETSGKWLPGYKDGKPVRVKYNFPVKFTMSKN